MKVTTFGIDLAKNMFQRHGSMNLANPSSIMDPAPGARYWKIQAYAGNAASGEEFTCHD